LSWVALTLGTRCEVERQIGHSNPPKRRIEMQRVVAQNDEWVASLLRTLIRNSTKGASGRGIVEPRTLAL
jgi:hypothetical protein